MIGIYKITSPTGKNYIGQSVDIKQRWYHYKNLQKKHGQHILFNSFKKYGFKTHKFDILETLDKKLNNKELIEWLDSKELLYSIQYNSLAPNGLNLRIGKGRGHVSKETNEKNKKSHLGPKNHMYGKKLSEDVKQKIRNKLKGEGCYWFGKKLSTETKKKISDFRKTFKSSKETCIKISKANTGIGNGMYGVCRTDMRKQVDQFSLNGEFIKTYPSVALAASEVECTPSSISAVCNNRVKRIRGYIWKYHNNKKIA